MVDIHDLEIEAFESRMPSRWRKSLLHWCTVSRIVFTVSTWRAFSFSMATTATTKVVSLALQRASLMAIMPTVKAMEKYWTVKPLFTQYWITMQPVQAASSVTQREVGCSLLNEKPSLWGHIFRGDNVMFTTEQLHVFSHSLFFSLFLPEVTQEIISKLFKISFSAFFYMVRKITFCTLLPFGIWHKMGFPWL